MSTTTTSIAVQQLKIDSSIALKKRLAFIRRMYLGTSVGYFSSTIGLNEDQIKRYIEWQGKKDEPQDMNYLFEPA